MFFTALSDLSKRHCSRQAKRGQPAIVQSVHTIQRHSSENSQYTAQRIQTSDLACQPPPLPPTPPMTWYMYKYEHFSIPLCLTRPGIKPRIYLFSRTWMAELYNCSDLWPDREVIFALLLCLWPGQRRNLFLYLPTWYREWSCRCYQIFHKTLDMIDSNLINFSFSQIW